MIHQSLNIEDRISALIRKQRLLIYKEGTSLAGIYTRVKHMLYLCHLGVQREYRFDRLKDSSEQWIRSISFFDDYHYLIICCTYAQAKAFTKVQCLEMDLSFKMVEGKTNVFSLAGWNDDTKRRKKEY